MQGKYVELLIACQKVADNWNYINEHAEWQNLHAASTTLNKSWEKDPDDDKVFDEVFFFRVVMTSLVYLRMT